ncbi:putative deaminase [Cyphellophora attinorum]|uniref:Putative deaminase n=1 Tax=Cyphellophora attinorum TaxID=1664694 RepID=A0A0N1NY03_9EURO|nr:putative deaminase [Phialophora attinorum]KPI35873.1 putative deaminase [Phialophora attinorum]
MGIEEALPASARDKLRAELLAEDHIFIQALPKVELHVHIEGTITAELRWKFTQRNGTPLRIAANGSEIHSLKELEHAMDLLRPDPSRVNNDEERFQFFEAYYEGFACLKTKQDYFDLAMHYYENTARMNVRYAEIFFDPQGHTAKGMSWDVMMGGFREAKERAERELNVKSAWIMCFLRDLSPESAMEHYEAALPYRDIIVGIGLDSNEEDRPPVLFDEVFTRARKDGFKLTMHCDADSKNAHEHIRQCASVVAGHGLDRIDHGINAAEDQGLMNLIKERDLGMTICPWSYLRHTTFEELGPKIRTLLDVGIKVTINSDDPAYMEDCWVLHNMLLVRRLCNFSDREFLVLARNAVHACWASDAVKEGMLREIDLVQQHFMGEQ